MPARCRRCTTATVSRPPPWRRRSRANCSRPAPKRAVTFWEKTVMTVRTTRRAVLLGVTGALATPSILRAQSPQVRLTLGHGAAPGNPRSMAADRMAAQLRERSNGRIEMRVAGSAQLGDDAAMLTALRTGTLDMSVNSQGASSAVLPELAALGLAFLFPNSAAAYKVVDGAVGDELSKRFENVGLVALGYW